MKKKNKKDKNKVKRKKDDCNMDIMTVLFDQDEVTRSLIEAKENRARKSQEKATVGCR